MKTKVQKRIDKFGAGISKTVDDLAEKFRKFRSELNPAVFVDVESYQGAISRIAQLETKVTDLQNTVGVRK